MTDESFDVSDIFIDKFRVDKYIFTDDFIVNESAINDDLLYKKRIILMILTSTIFK